MNLEQAIKNEVEKIDKFDWEQIFGKNSGAKKAVETLFATSLHSIAIATADALRVETVSLHDEYNEEESELMLKIFGSTTTSKYIKERRKGYKSAISDSLQREKEWFGIEAETPLVDNKEA